MANEQGKTEEYEVEGIGTVMLDAKDAEAFGKKAKKVKNQNPDPTAAQRSAEEAAAKVSAAATKAAGAPQNKAMTVTENKAAGTPATGTPAV